MGSSTSTMALVQCLNRLHSETDDDDTTTFREDNHAFWRQLFTTPFAQADLHSVVSAESVQLLMQRHPQRVAMLLYKCISQLYSFVWRQQQQQQGDQSCAPPVGSSLAVVNSLIILGRWLPVVLSEERCLINRSSAAQGPIRATGASLEEAPIEMSAVADAAPQQKPLMFVQWFFRENRMSPEGGAIVGGSTQREEVKRFPDLLCHERERQQGTSKSEGDMEEGAVRCPSMLHIPTSAASGGQAPLHLVLVHCLVHICFVPGFTIPHRRAPPPPQSTTTPGSTSIVVVDDPPSSGTAAAPPPPPSSSRSRVIARLLWARGLGDVSGASSEALDALVRWRRTANTSTLTSNRLLVMQTLLVLLSRPLYGTHAIVVDDLFTAPLTRSVPLFATLVASVVNYAVSYNPRGTLPYSSHFISEEEHLMVLCVQFLALSLDYSPLLLQQPQLLRSDDDVLAPTRAGGGAGTSLSSLGHEELGEGSAAVAGESATPPPARPETSSSSSHHATSIPHLLGQRHHGWHTLLSAQPSEAEYIVAHFTPLFTNVTYSLSTLLPKSQRRLLEHEELLILLYKLVDRCPNFLHALVSHPLVTEYVVPLCYYLTRVLHEPEKASVAHIALFTISRLVQERHFVLKCNSAFQARSIPFPAPDFRSPDGSATYADFLLVNLCSILQFKDLQHDGMCQLCATTIANMAPYCTSISLGASQRLVWQVEIYGRSRFFAEDVLRRGFVLVLLLEAVASLLQYQYRGSSHLAYVLVRTDATLRNVLSLLRAPLSATPPPSSGPVAEPPVRLHLPHHHDEGLSTGADLGAAAARSADIFRNIDHIAAHNCDLLHPKEALERYERVMSAIECALNELLAVAVPLLQSAALTELPRTLANDTTLVGSLPVPHVLITRRSPVLLETDEWMSKVLWGFVFTHTAPGTLAPFGAKDVALFELRGS